MKKVISILSALVLIFALGGCGSSENEADFLGKYTLKSVVNLGTVEENSTDKIKVSYTITITGSAEDIANLKKHKVIVTEETEKLLIEQGEETVESSGTEISIEGSMIFDTSGKSVDEINSMEFIQGVEIADKDGNSGTAKL